MTKQKKNIRETKPQSESFLAKFNLNEFIPQKHHPWVVMVIILILFLIFLSPLYFGNKTFQSGDIITMESMKSYLNKERDGFSLWNPYIFCGMPAYAIGTEPTWFNLIYLIYTKARDAFASLFPVQYAMWSFYLIILGITSFLFVRYLTKNTLVSLFSALATSFSTGIIVFLFIGHVTKLTSLCMYPLLFLLLMKLKDKITLLDFLLLIVTLQIFVQGFHVQIIFYTLFAVGIFFLYYSIRFLRRKEINQLKSLVKSGVTFLIAVLIALLIQSDNFTQIYEYTPYSTRGTESIIEKDVPKTEKTESDYYNYHTEWSFSPGEVLTFIVPSYYGFGNSKYKGPLTNNQEVEVNTYFGQMRFVDVAMYMGILVFLLGVYAMIALRKDPFVQFLTILTIISLLISFGRNFPVLFDLMFYYFPYFDKFRVPSMILVLVQMSMPVLAGLGLMKLISLRSEKNEKIRIVIRNILLVVSGIFVLIILLNSPISKWFSDRVIDYANSIQQSNPQLAQQYQALADYTAQMFTTDLTFAFLFIEIGVLGLYLFINRKISADIFILLFIILTVTDLWRIDSRGSKYVDNPDIKNLFIKPDYISFIEQQKEKEPFRIFNLKQDGSIGSFSNNANFHAYFLIEDFYGYSGIKPRAYQDYIDVVGPVNPALWNMLNVKYIIANQPIGLSGLKPVFNSGNTLVFLNENYLPRMFFVNSIADMNALDFLNKFKNGEINPNETAIVEDKDFEIQPADSTASIKISNYDEALIEAEVNASGNNFVFIGNSYHPGWKAYLNGEKIKVYKTNHGYLGVVIPKGKHNLRIEFAPESFFISKNISLILSSLVVFGLLVITVVEFRKKRIGN